MTLMNPEGRLMMTMSRSTRRRRRDWLINWITTLVKVKQKGKFFTIISTNLSLSAVTSPTVVLIKFFNFTVNIGIVIESSLEATFQVDNVISKF